MKDPTILARRAERLHYRAQHCQHEPVKASMWFFWSGLYKCAYIGLVHDDKRGYEELRRNLANPPQFV